MPIQTAQGVPAQPEKCRHGCDDGGPCRYRKRGVNDAGRVANEVEIEQVVDAGFDWRTGFPLLASLVQACPSSTVYCTGQAG